MKINDTIGILLGCRPTRTVLSIDPDDSVYEALEMLAKYNIGVLLVCKEIDWSESSRSGIMRAKASWAVTPLAKPRSVN